MTWKKERFVEDIGIDVDNVSFADIVRYLRFGLRFLQKLHPSNDSTTFREPITVSARSYLRLEKRVPSENDGNKVIPLDQKVDQ